jgi:hypothetical protein
VYIKKVRPTVLERMFAKVLVTEGCWLWTGRRTNCGYGGFSAWFEGKRTTQAHRVSFIAQVGPIPSGLEIDHLCRNRLCVRPEHMQLVTHRQNIRRSPLLTARGPLYTPPPPVPV